MPQELPRPFMRAQLQPLEAVADPAIRRPEHRDIPALGELMLNAYRGTIDYEGEDLPECLSEIEKTFRGEYGPFVAECSQVYEQAGTLLACVLVTRWENRPFIAFTMTERAAMRRGLARKCMVCAMSALQQAGECELRLVVTLANEPAVNLYKSLGFVVQE